MAPIDDIQWPATDFSSVPYAVFGDQDVFDREMERIFRGPVWCYLALEAEIPEPGDYKSVFVGDRSVVVNRAMDGTLHAFENRCAHRGSTVVRHLDGNATDYTCIYHHWNYDHRGKLIGVPFQRGIDGQGGMPEGFDKAQHGLRALKLDTYRGVVFASFAEEVEPLPDFLGEPMRAFLDRLFAKPVEIIGYARQRMPSNWKAYFENLTDPYHAGLLHQFQTTFGLFRQTQKGGTIMDRHKRHQIQYAIYDSDDAQKAEAEYAGTGVYDSTYTLEDPSIIAFRDEEGRGEAIYMMCVFPSILFQRLSNTLATRTIRPHGPDEFDLYWTYFGYADDDEELREMRIRQVNLIGPGGLISMEDGESGVQIQRAIGRVRDAYSTIQMGGVGEVHDQQHMVTEMPVRGFWRNYCELMGMGPQVRAAE